MGTVSLGGGGDGTFKNWVVLMGTQLCKFTENH